jgi:7,8-dihydro-6-hydroxymethylpterin-pyrophosphokinase
MRVVVACSSNMPDRFALVSSAVEAVAALDGSTFVTASRMSDMADTPRETGELSSLLLLETERAIAALIADLHAIEAEHGRVRGERAGHRPVLLEVVWADGVNLSALGVILPNPRLVTRADWQRGLAEVIGMAEATEAIAAAHGHVGTAQDDNAVRTEHRWSGGWDTVSLREGS